MPKEYGYGPDRAKGLVALVLKKKLDGRNDDASMDEMSDVKMAAEELIKGIKNDDPEMVVEAISAIVDYIKDMD